jgi:hypothetical protein
MRMRATVPTLLLATLLAACTPAPEPAPAAAPQPAAQPAPQPATPPAAAPVAAAPAKEVPQGTCGAQDAVPADQRIANTARWTTASEQNNFGFDVYRGDSEKGPFAKLTKSPILGAGTSDETHKYEYRDDSIDPCREYWYYVESINTNGTREKFTPTFHAPAKRRAAGSAPAAAPTPPTASGA